jgi:hypothetical protein
MGFSKAIIAIKGNHLENNIKQERDVPSRHIPFLTKYKPV